MRSGSPKIIMCEKDRGQKLQARIDAKEDYTKYELFKFLEIFSH